MKKSNKKSFKNPPQSRFFSKNTPSVDKPVATYSPSSDDKPPVAPTTPNLEVATSGQQPFTISNALADALRTRRPEVKSRRIQIVVTPTFYVQVDAMAKRLNVSLNEFIRMSLEHLMNDLTTPRQ